MWTFVNKRDVGEVVFTLRMAFQATNNPRNSSFGSLYSDICVFAADITRERTAAALRLQGDAARKRQSHRQELQEAREYAAAETLSSLKRSGDKVRDSLYFHQLGLLTPVKAKVVLKLGSKSQDSHSLHSDDGSPISDDDIPMPALIPDVKGQSDSEDDAMPMPVDPPHEARSSHTRLGPLPDDRPHRASDSSTGP